MHIQDTEQITLCRSKADLNCVKPKVPQTWVWKTELTQINQWALVNKVLCRLPPFGYLKYRTLLSGFVWTNTIQLISYGSRKERMQVPAEVPGFIQSSNTDELAPKCRTMVLPVLVYFWANKSPKLNLIPSFKWDRMCVLARQTMVCLWESIYYLLHGDHDAHLRRQL